MLNAAIARTDPRLYSVFLLFICSSDSSTSRPSLQLATTLARRFVTDSSSVTASDGSR